MDQNFVTGQEGLQNGECVGYQNSKQTVESTLSAFVLKFENKLYAYENKCPHLGIELDWIPGQVFDDEQAFLVCSTHGARFKPDTGKCISGPCMGQSLKRLNIAQSPG